MRDKAPQPGAGHAVRGSPAVAILAVILTGAWCAHVLAADISPSQILLREEFNTLDKWKPLKFSKIENMCTYTIDLQTNNNFYLRAQSSNSASGMVWQGEFNVYDHPMIRWRWKISNVYEKGNALEKSGIREIAPLASRLADKRCRGDRVRYDDRSSCLACVTRLCCSRVRVGIWRTPF